MSIYQIFGKVYHLALQESSTTVIVKTSIAAGTKEDMILNFGLAMLNWSEIRFYVVYDKKFDLLIYMQTFCIATDVEIVYEVLRVTFEWRKDVDVFQSVPL